MEGPIRNLPPDSPARGSSSMPDCSSTPVDPRWTVETTSSGARAEDHACQGEDVDADVEQGPAPEVGVDVGAEAQVGLHHAEFAHRALAISSRARATAGTKRADMASMWNSSRRRAASITRRASAALMVKGCLAQDRLPGDCSFHHGHVLHSSRANVSGRRRRGYATDYVSAHCR